MLHSCTASLPSWMSLNELCNLSTKVSPRHGRLPLGHTATRDCGLVWLLHDASFAVSQVIKVLFLGTCFHPLHRLHKYWGTFRFLIGVRWVASFVPFETRFSFTLFVWYHVPLWGNNAAASFAAVQSLRFLISFHYLFSNQHHIRDDNYLSCSIYQWGTW